MALHQPPHNLGLARGAKRRTDLLGLLHGNQPIDDIAARHQQAVDLTVDRIDLLAQHLERGRSGGRFGHLGNLKKVLPHPRDERNCVHPWERRLRRVSKDETCSPSWFETAQGRLLTMRGHKRRLRRVSKDETCSPPWFETAQERLPLSGHNRRRRPTVL